LGREIHHIQFIAISKIRLIDDQEPTRIAIDADVDVVTLTYLIQHERSCARLVAGIVRQPHTGDIRVQDAWCIGG